MGSGGYLYNTIGAGTTAAAVVMQFLALVSVGLRIFTRIYLQKKRLRDDDYTIFVALVFSLIMATDTVVGTTIGGVGAPIDLLVANPEAASNFAKVLLIDELFYLVTVTIIRVSLILSYKHIFVTKSFKTTANVTLGITVLWLIIFFILELARDLSAKNVYFRDAEDMISIISAPATTQVAVSATDIALDLLVLCLPLPVIHQLNLSTKRKFAVAGLFWLGAFCVIASVVRLYFAVETFYVARNNDLDSFDTIIANLFIWSHVEPCGSIVAACLPALGPLFRRKRSPQTTYTLSENRRTQSEQHPLAKLSPRSGQRQWTELKSERDLTGAEGLRPEIGGEEAMWEGLRAAGEC